MDFRGQGVRLDDMSDADINQRSWKAMVEKGMPVVLLYGSAHERGLQHGSKFAAKITHDLASRRQEDPLRWSSARSRAGRSWDLLMSRAPTVAQELIGISEGSKCDLLDVYLHSGFEFISDGTTTGCTAIAVKGQGGGALVAQNWDALPGTEDDLALFVHIDASGFQKAMVSSVGMLGWVGCNRHGLAFVNNDLMLDTAQEGLPSQVVRRLILDEANLRGAFDVLNSVPHMGGRAYVIGDQTGQVGVVEVSPKGGQATIEGLTVLHTNHAISDLVAYENKEALETTYPSSAQRLRALTSLAEKAEVRLEDILRDRRGAPDSICKSPSIGEPTQTAFSIIIDCTRRHIKLCRGKPSEQFYGEFSF